MGNLGGASGIRTLGTIICSGFAFAAFLGMVSAKALGMSAPEGSRSAILRRLSRERRRLQRESRVTLRSRILFLTCFAELKERSCAPR
jgi:hypothetical protein